MIEQKMDSEMQIRIIIADDHRIMCQGLSILLEKEPDMEVVAHAENGQEVLALAEEHKPDIVIMDINMPGMDGIEATRQISKKFPEIKVLVLSAHSHKHVIDQILRAGAVGFIVKEIAFEELARAVRAVNDSGVYLCPNTAEIFVSNYLISSQKDQGDDNWTLSSREYEIIRLLSQGRSSKEIAHILDKSVKTIDACRREIFKKLKINSVAELTKFAIREGITTL